MDKRVDKSVKKEGNEEQSIDLEEFNHYDDIHSPFLENKQK